MKGWKAHPMVTAILISTLLVVVALLYVSKYRPEGFIYMQF